MYFCSRFSWNLNFYFYKLTVKMFTGLEISNDFVLTVRVSKKGVRLHKLKISTNKSKAILASLYIYLISIVWTITCHLKYSKWEWNKDFWQIWLKSWSSKDTVMTALKKLKNFFKMLNILEIRVWFCFLLMSRSPSKGVNFNDRKRALENLSYIFHIW